MKHDFPVVIIQLLEFSTKVEGHKDPCLLYDAACVEFDFVKGSHVSPNTDDAGQDGN